MRGFLGIIAGVCLFGLVQAQDVRELAIWTSAHHRFVVQMDRWFEDGDYTRCIQLLRVMHEIDPHDYTTATDLGWMLGNIEEHDQELAVYKAYRLAYPEDPEAAYPEGELYFRQKKFDKVPPIIASTIAKKPHPNSYRILAHSYERLGRLLEAKEVWVKLIADYPNDRAVDTAQLHLKQVEEKLKKAETPK